MLNKQLDEEIFIILCDISIEKLKKSNMSYFIACNYILELLERNNLELISHYLNDIYLEANKIFSFKLETMMFYIYRFFLEKQYIRYFTPITGIVKCFGNYSQI